MTESNSLVSLRRAVALKLRMPFSRRFSSGSSTLGSGSTTSYITDPNLSQTDGFWNNHWFYLPSTQEVSLIRSFRADTDRAYLEAPLANSPASGTAYEIHSVWNAHEIREALNTAIRTARRSFPYVVTSVFDVVQEDKVTYSLSNLTDVPMIINKVWIEQRTSVMCGGVSSATATTAVLDANVDVVTPTWTITIYAGTGAGQSRSIVSASGQTVEVAAWDTEPDITSKYCLFDTAEELVGWKLFTDLRYNNPEFPTILYFNRVHPEDYGMRIRLEYVAVSAELSTESSTTNIPREYLLLKSCSELHAQALSSTKADKETHFGEYKRMQDEADEYIIRNGIHTPGTVLLNPDVNQRPFTTSDNPLGWGR